MSYRCIVLALCSLLLAPISRAQAPATGDGGLAVAQSSSLALEEALLGIIAYTRWPSPQQPQPLRLCVLGTGAHADRLRQRGLPRLAEWPTITVHGIGPQEAIASQCDTLYVGQLSEDDWHRIRPGLLGRPVLTVCERSPVCITGGMFCLDIDAAGYVQFEANLDAIARSHLRVHPQVLRLGRRPAGKRSP